MRIYLCWLNWGLHYNSTRYRLCEQTRKATELAIGPLWFEWDQWV